VPENSGYRILACRLGIKVVPFLKKASVDEEEEHHHFEFKRKTRSYTSFL
jgi:hypothetical protein